MKKPHVTVRCPKKENIIYSVAEKYAGIDIFFMPLVELKRTIIFCHSYKDHLSIYYFFKDAFKDGLTDPIGYPDIAKFRIVDMFSACNSLGMKSQIFGQLQMGVHAWPLLQ